jgi:hypothetical protein
VDELITYVFVLAVVLGIVTLIGHGIWVVLAKLFSPPANPSAPRCLQCGAVLRGRQGGCTACGWAVHPTPMQRKHAVQVTLWRQAAALAERGLIDHDAREQLFKAILEQTERAPVKGQPDLTNVSAETQTAPPKEAEPVYVATAVPAEPPTREPVDTGDEPDDAPEYRLEPIGDVSARARQYAERRAAAELSPSDTAIPAPPIRRSRTFAEVFAAFLEESNIRWGELVGGLLIVCCSIALVISFWAEIAQRPFLKFFVFNGVTAAMFGVGFYSQRRWKLESTSRALLIIGMLLVPLNFLAIAAFGIGETALDLTALAGEATSTVLFSALLYFAGRIVLSRGAWLVVPAVVLPSIVTLLVRRHVDPGTSEPVLWMLATAALLCYSLTNAGLVASERRRQPLDAEAPQQLFTLLGISTFAITLPLGLLLFKSGDLIGTLHRLSPLVVLMSIPALGVGVLLWQKLDLRQEATVRTSASSIALLGLAVIISANVFAWPTASAMLPTVAFTCAVAIAAAMVYRIREAHLVVGICLVWATLLGVLLVSGDLAWESLALEVIDSLVSSTAAIALVIMAMVGAIGGLWWARHDRRIESFCYLGVAVAASAASVGVASWLGLGALGDENGAALVYGLNALGYLAAAWLSRRDVIGWIAALLLLLTTVQSLAFTYRGLLAIEYPWLTTLLAHAAIGCPLAVAAQVFARRSDRGFARPLRRAALLTSLGAATLVVLFVPSQPAAVVATSSVILCALWFVLGVLENTRGVVAIGQAALVSAMVFSVYTWLETYEWFEAVDYPWLDPRTLQFQGVALSLLAAVWLALRMLIPRGAANFANVARHRSTRRLALGMQQFGRFIRGDAVTLDHVLACGLLTILLALAVYGAAPGAVQELSPRATSPAVEGSLGPTPRSPAPLESFEILGIAHSHAFGSGSWLLMACVMAALLVSLRVEYRLWKSVAVPVALSAAVPLLAARWEGDVAVASALRWLASGYLLVCSGLIWLRGELKHILARTKLVPAADFARGSSSTLRNGVIVLSLLPLFAMGSFVAVAAVLRTDVLSSVAGVFAAALFIAVALGGVAFGTRQMRFAWGDTLAAWGRQTSTLFLILGIGPLVAVSFYVVATALRQHPIVGPDPESVFAQMGTAISYAVPVLITAVVLAGYGLRERDAAFAFAAALVLCVAATAGYLLWSATQRLPFDANQWIRLAHLNSAVAALYSLGWIAVLQTRYARPGNRAAANPFLGTLVALGASLHAIVLAVTTGALFLDPIPATWMPTVGDPWGWASLVAALVAATIFLWPARGAIRLSDAWAAIFLCGVMIAAVASRWDTRDWLSFHVLLVTCLAAAWTCLGFGWLNQRDSNSIRHAGVDRTRVFSTTLGVLAVIAGLRSLGADPHHPWWAVAAFLCTSALSAALAVWSIERRFVVIAALLLNLAASLVWLEIGSPSVISLELWCVNLIALALPVPLWFLLECFLRRAVRGSPPPGVAWHAVAAWLSLAGVACVPALGLLGDWHGQRIELVPWLRWLAFASAGVAAVTGLWDAAARRPVAALYALGLIAAAMLLDELDLTPTRMIWTGLMVLAAYNVATSFLWSRREKLRRAAVRLRIPTERRYDNLDWLVPSNCLLAIVIAILGYWVQLRFAEAELRLSASQAVLAQALSIGLLAYGVRRSQLQYGALLMGVVGAVAFGWSWLDPETTGTLLNRVVVVLSAIAAMCVLYAIGLSKIIRRQNEWTRAAEALAPALVAAGAVTLFLFLSMEVGYYVVDGALNISWWAIATVAITLVGLSIACLIAAVVPGHDPLRLPEHRRTAYVYATEPLLALLFVHLRLSMPWLFEGVFRQYWPLIVILIAFVGVGLSELFRRQHRLVLAEPLERTGALLPLLPVLGFWLVPNEVHFSVTLVAAGGIYAILSLLRRSFAYGILAALAANGALWYLLHRAAGWGLLEHPQLWFIPPALCVLVAAYLNRESLSEQQLTSIRYGAASAIYVTSTADVFLNGVAEAPWLPVILAAISLVGIFAGIMLRVRSFLLLGTGFLMLSLFTIIWYAAVDLEQTWLWSATGIVAGILIIAVFAVFEKKRQDVLRLVDQLKQWHS